MFIKKMALAALVAIFFINSTNAQSNASTYKNAIGVKIFDGAGITFSFLAKGC